MTQITMDSDNPYARFEGEVGLMGKMNRQSMAHAQTEYLRTGETPNGYSVNPDADIQPDFGDQGASLTRSMIHRAQWQDYLDRFRPYEDKLIGMYGSEGLDGQISRNLSAVDSAFSNSQRSASDKRKLYNANMTRRQSDQYFKKMNMQRDTAKVHAANMTRLARKDRNMELLAGSSTSPNLTE